MLLILGACFLSVVLLMSALSHESNLAEGWEIYYLLEVLSPTIVPARPLVNLL